MNGNKLQKTASILLMLVLILGGVMFFSTPDASAGNFRASFGTNNTTSYYPANGTGGLVEMEVCTRTNKWGCNKTEYQEFQNVGDSKNIYNDSPKFKVTPSTGYNVKFIKYARRTVDFGDSMNSVTWTSVNVTNPSGENGFTLTGIDNNNDYVIWVCFETFLVNYDVTATVYQDATPTACQLSSFITKVGTITGSNVYTLTASVAKDSTTTVGFSAGSGCEVEDVRVNTNTVGVQASPYTTPAITATTTIVVKFRPVSYVITASIDPASPGYVSASGLATSGTISPMGATSVGKDASQTFTITPASGFRILNVRVTDPAVSYVNKDLGALTNQYGTSYTFTGVTANGSIVVTFALDSTTANNYCQTPPFLSSQTTLKPNVLIIFDNSGSMGYKAYDIDDKTYSSNTTYYGYYDVTKMYKITSSTVHNINSAGLNKTANCSSQTVGKICSGNELNFRNMNRVDVIRKILMGGKIKSRTTTTKYLVTDSDKEIEYGPDLPVGVVQKLDGKVRFGLMVFNQNSNTVGTGDGGRIVAEIGTAGATLVSLMETDTDPYGNTPLGESMYEAVRYFEAKGSAYNSGVDYGTMDPIEFHCQKNFVLMITDGEPTRDGNVPGQTGANVTDASFTAWWTTAKTKAVKPVETGSSFLSVVSYYAHVNDLRSATVGKNEILGKQNLTIFTVYSFGDGSGTAILKEAAKFGGFNDKDEKDTPGYLVPDQLKEYNAAGITGGDPDNFYEANEGDVLETNIVQAMSDILAKVASGTAASILSNSEGSGANLLQAVFYPNKIFKNTTEVNWVGEMQNLWYYVDPLLSNSSIREDTDYVSGDHVLNLKSDHAVRFYFDGTETLAELKQDTDGDGSGDTIISASSNPDDVKSIWRAGKLLWSRTAENRTIHTSKDGQLLYHPTIDSKGGFYSDTTRANDLIPYLQAFDLAEAKKLINYVRGSDQEGYRNRKVSVLATDTPTEWKLGDIISSTPRLQSSNPLHTYNMRTPMGYGDYSYNSFINTTGYKNRGMVYVGANDGMLHAFKLGKLEVSGAAISGDTKATLKGSSLGDEQWAYVPRNALPYLKYYADPNDYKHIYYVDGPTVLVDAAIAKPALCASGSDYSNCEKDNEGGTNWRTVLIGSMGLGGASRLKGDSCTNGSGGTCVKTPIYDPLDTATTKTKGIGYSSYFAFDITGQYFDSSGALVNQPTLKWEFTHPELGYATSGAAIVRIGAKKTVPDPNDATKTITVTDKTKNGKYFAVFASGPTGPIDETAHQFIGKSDQNLKLFVVDLGATGALTKDTNYWIIDTGVKRAFGGSILNATIDTDRWNAVLDGNYQDDALYVGYTKANIGDTASITTSTEWTEGGVIRLVTKEDINPANWKTSTVISGTGPVTSGIARLQDRKDKKLWLYFGSGRFYYGGDDPSNRRYLMGVTDSCYNSDNSYNKDCADNPPTVLTKSDLKQQDTIGNITTEKGWYITLDAESALTSMGAERSITDPVALTNGLVVFTTFKPTSDVCKFGGDSYVWGVKYNTGGAPPGASLDAKVLVQISTGAFEEVTLRSALTDRDGRKQGTAMVGKPPVDPPPVVSNASNKPPKKILHIQER
ncbi:MAG: pilus assembly protein [Desulfuromonadaceae bacterium]